MDQPRAQPRRRRLLHALMSALLALAFAAANASEPLHPALEQAVAREALRGYALERSATASAAEIEAHVSALLRASGEVSEPGVIELVARTVVGRAPGGAIAVALLAGDSAALQEAVLAETAEALLSLTRFSGGPLSTLIGAAGPVGRALGQAVEGDAAGAAATLTTYLGDQLGAADVVALAVDVRDQVVHRLWLEPAMESAFAAYRDGANEARGYSVAPRDFEALLEQMPAGVLREFYLSSIQAHAAQRGLDVAALSEAERSEVRREAEAALRASFEERVEREPEIAAREAALRNLFEAFDARGLLFVSDLNPMVPSGASITHEQLAARILRFTDQVKRDTGRTRLVTDDEFIARLDDGQRLPPYGVAAAALAWYRAGPEDCLEAYTASLIADGLLSAPEPDDAASLLGRAYCAAVEGRASILAEDPNPLWNDYRASGDPRFAAMEAFPAVQAELYGAGANDLDLERGVCALCPEHGPMLGASCR